MKTTARNKIISGDYKGSLVRVTITGGACIGISGSVPLNSSTVAGCELVHDERRKSAASGITRGLVGGAVFGLVGAAAGAMSAKEKGKYTVAIYFHDGKQSLAELDEKMYNIVIKSCFSKGIDKTPVRTPTAQYCSACGAMLTGRFCAYCGHDSQA